MAMILGVTGGIAAGKSTIVDEFARLGATVICADDLAREVVRPGQPLLRTLAEHFGSEVITAQGELDRPVLAQVIFSDETKRIALNQLMHPTISRLADERLREALEGNPPLVVYDAALLYEAGAEGQVDAVLVVTADESIRQARLMQRNGVSEAEAMQRVRAQKDVAQAIKEADFRIDNSGSLEETLRQVGELYRKLSCVSGDKGTCG